MNNEQRSYNLIMQSTNEEYKFMITKKWSSKFL